jgi:hypothetical protein
MKGHPKSGHPKGVLMKEVNALVASVTRGASEDALLLALGPPDERAPDDDDGIATYVLGYVDPYRPRRTYYFGIKNGVVTHRKQVSRTTLTSRRAPK